MTWYAIRTVYCWGQRSDGKNVFEERVVAFSAMSHDEAFEKARQEATAYSSERRDIQYEIHPDQSAYELDEANWVDGLRFGLKCMNQASRYRSFTRIDIESMITTPNKSHNPPLEPMIGYGV